MNVQTARLVSNPEPSQHDSIEPAGPETPHAPDSAQAMTHRAAAAPALYAAGHRMPQWLAALVRRLPEGLISRMGIHDAAPPAGSARPRGIDRMIMPVRSRHAFSRHSGSRSLASVWLRQNAWAVPYAGNILPVPYVLQRSANECWRAAFSMIGRYYGRPDIDYSDMPELYNGSEYDYIRDGDILEEVLRRENLQVVDGCNDPDRKFSIQELEALLRKHGPIAFSWQPENVPFFEEHPERHHWCVIVKADPDSSRITYLNPMRRRNDPEGKRVRKDWINIDEFNSLRTYRPASLLQSTLGNVKENKDSRPEVME